MVNAYMELHYAMGDGIKRIEDNEKDTVMVQRRAFYAQRDMKAGEVIMENDIFPLRPAKEGRVLPYEKDKISGMTLMRDLKADECLCWNDIALKE